MVDMIMPKDLSARDKEVLRLLALGMSNAEIGKRLCLARGSVAGRITTLYRKVGPYLYNGKNPRSRDRSKMVLLIRWWILCEEVQRPDLLELAAPEQDKTVSEDEWNDCPETYPNITKREIEVVALVSEGYSNDAIANRMFITPETVRNYLTSIYGKLGISRYRNGMEKTPRSRLIEWYEKGHIDKT